MRVIRDPASLSEDIAVARREALAAFGNDEVYLEKLVERARHVEVQVLGDIHGNLVHLFERDCTVQRRNQKVVERAPAPYLDDEQREELCSHALRLAAAAGYRNAGTVEFLMDADTGAFYFIEVNPRVQVEHTVTEEVTGIDIVKAQICLARGARIGDRGQRRADPEEHSPERSRTPVPGHHRGPENQFIPDYGRIRTYRSASGFGIRLDGGTAYAGAVDHAVLRFPAGQGHRLGARPGEAVSRMVRALREFRIRGVASNLAFLVQVIRHPRFLQADYTTRFIDRTPELFEFRKPRDRASRLLKFLPKSSSMAIRRSPDASRQTPGRRRRCRNTPATVRTAAYSDWTDWVPRDSPAGCSSKRPYC